MQKSEMCQIKVILALKGPSSIFLSNCDLRLILPDRATYLTTQYRQGTVSLTNIVYAVFIKCQA